MLAYKPESKQPPVHFEKVSNLKHFGWEMIQWLQS
jgi:hypothetical protein